MPSFNVDDITIDPDDYVSGCSEREIEKLLDEIRRTETEIYDDFITRNNYHDSAHLNVAIYCHSI